jgi:murein DD-endopeptidase MepM/ murein hydrolase activator NlpD
MYRIAMLRAQDRALARCATASVLAVVLILAGCVRHGPPAPVISATGGFPTAGAIAQSPGERPDSVIVQPGETLYGISRRYGVPLRSLIEANELQPPFNLVSGKRLTLPQVRTYIVQPGDTLLGLSRRFGVDASTLARSNDIPSPYPVKLGQVLILPPSVTAATPASPSMPVFGGPIPVNAAPVNAEALAAPPPTVADTATPPSSPVWHNAPGAQAPAADGGPALAPSPSPQSATGQAVAWQSAGAAPPQAISPPAVASLPPSSDPGSPKASTTPLEPPHTGRGFAWPVRGPVLTGYGPGANGTQNDGINIGAPLGTAILAANDGVVAYAGNELRGFGNLVLLKHADGWMTAYAHCESIAVKRGDRIKRGEMIARVGATGAVGEPQLHFELRRGTRALDPQGYLPPVSTATAG